MSEPITVPVTDQSTYLIFHLPEGRFTLHAASTNRPLGPVTGAVLARAEKVVGRGKKKQVVFTGYHVTQLAYAKGAFHPSSYVHLDINLVQKDG